jgi:hypothetical protein
MHILLETFFCFTQELMRMTWVFQDHFKLKINPGVDSFCEVMFVALLLQLFHGIRNWQKKINATFPFSGPSQVNFPFVHGSAESAECE